MLLSDVEYKRELEKVAEQLKDSASLVDIRGDGAAQFIFAVNGSRALEISQSEEGVWIEFWQGEDESPAQGITVSSYDEAVIAAIEWLNSLA